MRNSQHEKGHLIASMEEKLGITFKQIGYLLAANLGYALAINLFYIDNQIAAGGLAGLGTILNTFLHIPVGFAVFMLNLPICLWGLGIKGKRYIITSVVTIGIFSVIVDALAFLPCLTHDKLVAVVCGGIIYGSSTYCSIRAQISTGGTDLLAKLAITKLKFASVGQLLLFFDGSIVVLAMIVYKNIETGIYAILAIAVSSMVTDRLNNGFNKANMFYIFSSKNMDKMVNAILYEMGRGATKIRAEGIFAHKERDILLVVVRPHETPKLKDIVHKYDPSAFVILSSASEVIGEGFESLSLTSTIHDDDDVEWTVDDTENSTTEEKERVNVRGQIDGL